MKHLKPNTETVIWTLFLGIAIFSFCSCESQWKGHAKHPGRGLRFSHRISAPVETDPNPLKGYTIDLPEEIGEVDSTDNLGASIDDSAKIIHFYFKHH